MASEYLGNQIPIRLDAEKTKVSVKSEVLLLLFSQVGQSI